MKKTAVSRTRNKIVLVTFVVTAVLFLLSAILQKTALLEFSILLFLAIAVLLLCTNPMSWGPCFMYYRCPQCGRYFRGVYWSKTAGSCEKCGARIFFDDELGA